jgi:hypothetical protein
MAGDQELAPGPAPSGGDVSSSGSGGGGGPGGQRAPGKQSASALAAGPDSGPSTRGGALHAGTGGGASGGAAGGARMDTWDPDGLTTMFGLVADAGPPKRSSGGWNAGGPVMQAKPGGALIPDADRKRSADRLPGALKISVLGDPFLVELIKRDGKLFAEITYLGPHPSDATAPMASEAKAGRKVALHAEPDRAAGAAADPRPLAVEIRERTSSGVTFDLYGDGTQVVEILDVVDDFLLQFDRRRHSFTAKWNGFPSYPGGLSLQLPAGGKGSSAQDRVASAKLALGSDAFTVRARRHGDADAVVLGLRSERGGAEEQVIVPLPKSKAKAGAAQEVKPLTLRVLSSGGREIRLDLDGDGEAEATLIHTMRSTEPPRPAGTTGPRPIPLLGKPSEHEHFLAVYDEAGVRTRDMRFRLPGSAGKIPEAQDAAKNPPPDGAPVPDSAEPVQGDSFHESSRAVRNVERPHRDWELRIDGDGDRGKELLLRFIPTSTSIDVSKGRTYTLKVIQLSSGASASATFSLSADQALQFEPVGPELMRASNGHGPVVIHLGGPPTVVPPLTLQELPFAKPDRTTYRGTLGGAQEMTFSLPRETRRKAWMTDPEAPSGSRRNSTIESTEVAISEFRDRFRLTAEKVDSGSVLLGVSALGAEGAVAGFSTRLIGVDEPRVEQAYAQPDQLSFFVRRNWGIPNMYLASAIDPPKNAQGQPMEAPLSVHRDHRLTLHGDAVLGEPEHTFRVRDGRFVAGWDKSSDSRRAAGAGQAAGVLEEQGKQLGLAEFRIQIDSALDVELTRAVELGWIDGLTLDAWSQLKEDMIFVQAQAGSGKLDPSRVARAAEAVAVVTEWLARSSLGYETGAIGSRRRLAPGEAQGPGGREPFNGITHNRYTGDVWNVKDSVLTDVRTQGYGPQTVTHLEAGRHDQALASYQKLRSGISRWLGKKFELDPKFGKDSPEVAKLGQLAALGESLGELEEVEARTRWLDAAVDREVTTAGQLALIPPATVAAWDQLREAMVLIGGQSAGSKSDPTLAITTASHAGAIDSWLRAATKAQTTDTAFGKVNPFTGESEPLDGHQWMARAASHGQVMRDALMAGDSRGAIAAYRELRGGVMQWIAVLTTATYGKLSPEAWRARSMAVSHGKKRDIMRIPAMFTADESYEALPDNGAYKQADFGKYRQLPMQLFVWAEGGKWHLRDLTNAKKVWEGSVDFHDEEQPPPELFAELDHKRHLPLGVIHYDLPGGDGRTQRCRAKKEWYEFVAEMSLVIAAAGLVLMTLGTAAPVVVGAFAASAVVGTIGTIGELADGLGHGFADDKMIALNVIDIVANMASLLTMGGGKLAMGAAKASTAAKAGRGVAWTGGLAKVAKLGSLIYTPMLGLQIASDGLSVLILTVELREQMSEIDRTVKDPNARMRAKAALLARFAVTGGLVILSLKGDLPDLRSGAPRLVLDKVGGVTTARVGDVEAGGKRLNLPDGDANLHAAARWQERELRDEARSGTAAEQKRAKELLADEEFQGWYRKWLEQPQKLLGGAKRPTVQPPAGAPPHVVKRLQELADAGDLEVLERAFGRAGDVERLRKAAGGLDLDPHNTASWPATRKQLVDQLTKEGGGGAAARKHADELVGRYEHARLGAGTGDYAAERAKLNEQVPDSELERIKNLYPEYEVHANGVPGKQGTPEGERMEIAVVVPNGTEAAVMYALEQRGQGFKVHGEQASGSAANRELNLRVKVMTEDQFFGMATAGGKKAPRYHHLGDDVAEALGVPGAQLRAVSAGRYAVEAEQLKRVNAEARKKGGGNAGKLQYDADSHSMYFELKNGKAKARIEAPLAPRITSVGDWGQANRVVGLRTFDRGAAEDIMRRIVAGDFSEVSRQLGVELPPGFNTSDGLEFGLGQLPDGRYVIIRGGLGEVSWEGLPGIKAVGHSHPSVTGNFPKDPRTAPTLKGNDLPPDSTGQHRESIANLKSPTADMLLSRGYIFPSPEDVHFSSFHELREHKVFTSFVVKDGFVMKPPPGWTGQARLEFTIQDAQRVGELPGKIAVHKATLTAVFEGKQVFRVDVHVTGATPADPLGTMFMKSPPGLIKTR